MELWRSTALGRTEIVKPREKEEGLLALFDFSIVFENNDCGGAERAERK
jgi:hypothetical protein